MSLGTRERKKNSWTRKMINFIFQITNHHHHLFWLMWMHFVQKKQHFPYPSHTRHVSDDDHHVCSTEWLAGHRERERETCEFKMSSKLVACVTKIHLSIQSIQPFKIMWSNKISFNFKWKQNFVAFFLKKKLKVTWYTWFGLKNALQDYNCFFYTLYFQFITSIQFGYSVVLHRIKWLIGFRGSSSFDTNIYTLHCSLNIIVPMIKCVNIKYHLSSHCDYQLS